MNAFQLIEKFGGSRKEMESSESFMESFEIACEIEGITNDKHKKFFLKTRLRSIALIWMKTNYNNEKFNCFENVKRLFLQTFTEDWFNNEEAIELLAGENIIKIEKSLDYNVSLEQITQSSDDKVAPRQVNAIQVKTCSAVDEEKLYMYKRFPEVERLLNCDNVCRVEQEDQLIVDSEAEVTALSPECETQKEIDLSGDKSELEVVECLSEVEKVNTENFTFVLLKENDKNLEIQSDNNCSSIKSRDELFNGYLPVIKGENHTPETVIERNGKENIDCQLRNEIEIGYSKCNKTRLCYNIITVSNKIYCTFLQLKRAAVYALLDYLKWNCLICQNFDYLTLKFEYLKVPFDRGSINVILTI